MKNKKSSAIMFGIIFVILVTIILCGAGLYTANLYVANWIKGIIFAIIVFLVSFVFMYAETKNITPETYKKLCYLFYQ